jgi:hypothetical protein
MTKRKRIRMIKERHLWWIHRKILEADMRKLGLR